MQLQGKVAVITGASSGIGKEIALLFAQEGAIVILTARHLDKLQAVEKQIENAESFEMNITDRTQIKKVVDSVLAKHKKIDILVNSAGVVHWGSIQDCTDKEFDDQISINLIGYYNCIKAILPSMEKQSSGCIVNLISGAGKLAKPGTAAYSASKFGAAGLSDAVFEDVKDKGINVTAIYPGKTDTPIHDAYLDKGDPKRKKFLDPKEVARAALYAATLPSNTKMKELVLRPLG